MAEKRKTSPKRPVRKNETYKRAQKATNARRRKSKPKK